MGGDRRQERRGQAPSYTRYKMQQQLIAIGRNFWIGNEQGRKEIPSGQHQVRMEFAYDGGGMAKGGLATLYLDGEKIGEGRVEHTEPILFSADETCDLGYEAGSPVSEDYGPRGNEFTGEVNWVEIDLGEDAKHADHYIDPEERLRVYKAIQ